MGWVGGRGVGGGGVGPSGQRLEDHCTLGGQRPWQTLPGTHSLLGKEASERESDKQKKLFCKFINILDIRIR